MKRLGLLGAVVLAAAGMAMAQTDFPVFQLPRFTQPPVLDGVRGPAEWSGTLQLEVSVSQFQRDSLRVGADLAWTTGANQLGQSPGEPAVEARTDADYSANVWMAWDDQALWYLVEARDNYRDVEGLGMPTNWWERDGMTLYVDLVNSRDEVDPSGIYKYRRAKLNLIHTTAAPQNSSPVTVTWERLIQDTRTPTQDPADIEGIAYGFRDAGIEFGAREDGGGADYVLEVEVPWRTLLRYNLPAIPDVGTEMSFMWLAPDPDGDDGWNGQLQCWGQGDVPSTYSIWIFSAESAGPAPGTAVQEDSWGRIKATFAE